jgi:hypothetical protein
MAVHVLPAEDSAVQSAQFLHQTLEECADYFAIRLKPGSKVVILNMESGYPRLSAYIIEELTALIVNGGVLKPVERQNLDQLQQEIQYQLSGEVSDDTAKNIGRHVGADAVITGKISPIGNGLRLQIRVIDVETAEIPAMATKTIRRNDTVNALLRGQPGDTAAYDDAWKYKRLYVGARGGAAPRSYTLNTTDRSQASSVSAEGAIPLRIQFTDMFSVGAELGFSADRVEMTEPDVIVTAMALQIPVLARASFYYGKFSFGLFAGPYFAIPLGDMTVTYGGETTSYQYTAPPGLLAGGTAGMKLGSGVLFLDLRGGVDLGAVQADSAEQYHRTLFTVSAGYEFGLFDR